MSSPNKDFRVFSAFAALTLLLLAASACRPAQGGDAPTATQAKAAQPKAAQPAPATAEQAQEASAVAQVADNGGGSGTAPEREAKPADDDDEDLEPGETDERDYWRGVHFDVVNFDEMLDYVGVEYIDAKPDTHRAWIEAANFALMSLEPAEELLPESFYQARTGKPEEEGRLDGKTEPFACRGQPLPKLVLHHLPSDEYLKAKRPVRKKGRLSDEEVLALRERIKTRSNLYNDAWKAIPFDRPTFDCVMGYVQVRIKQIQAEAKAKKAAAKAGGTAAAKADIAKTDTAKSDPSKSEPSKSDTAKSETAKSETAKSDPVKASPAKADATKANAGKADTGKADTGKAEASAVAVAAPSTAKPDAKKAEKDEKPRPLPDMNRAWESAAQGYLYALDPHSTVIPRKAWDDSTDKTQDSSFEGIGAVLTQRDDQTIVENPMEGRPAWRAGIRAGDIIHKVNGNDVSGLALNKVVKQIRGPRNTKVVLTISRETDPEPKEYAITRENIEMKNVDGKLLPDAPGVAHVKMTGFIPNSAKDLRAMIDKLASQAPGGKLTGLVLDLRNNSGGLLSKAIEIADAFLTKGRIVSVKSRKKPEEVHSATASSSDYTFPLVVLVNDGAASASEIVASALQDNGRGLVIGTRTFGKASVQTLFEPQLHMDYYIKMTVARYYAPSGYTIQVVGVAPDVEVAPGVDGKIPVGFREENLNNHLTPVEGRAQSPWAALMPELKGCIDTTGKAEAIAKKDPKPQIQPDFQLLRAADYIRCLAQRPNPTAR